MRPLALVALSALSACSEYELSKPPDAELPPSTSPGGTTTATVVEDTCEDAPREPWSLPIDPTCAEAAVTGGFAPVVRWAWTDNPIHRGYDQVMVTPVVADLDRDGFSDVVFTAFRADGGPEPYATPGAVVAVSGADGSTLWSVTAAAGHAPFGAGGVALGDLDGDGVVEVVVAATDGLLCLDAAGAFRWHAAVPPTTYGYPAIGDLDGDGRAEVVLGGDVVDADGRPVWSAGLRSDRPLSFAVDLDGDGLSEVIDGGRILEHDGAVRVDAGDGFSAVGDLDLDGAPEVVLVYPSAVDVRDPSGAVRWSFPLDDWGGGPPTIADFDGDGLPEIGVASKDWYRVLRADGALAWQRAVQDVSSARTGSSVFDFEGDGRADVVYADEEVLYVWDGATGADKLAWTEHASGTLYEYPVIVDLDADDSAEIVVAGNDFATGVGHRGITVLADADASWSDARAIWNQHAYYVTNVDDDGGIPVPAPNWLTLNHFRDNDPWPDAGEAPLARILAGEPTVCCVDGVAEVWVPLEDDGPADAGPVTVALHDSAGVELATVVVDGVASGAGRWAGPLVVGEDQLGALVLAWSAAGQCGPTDGARAVVLACD